MRFYLIVAKGKRQGLPIPIEIDLFLMGSDPICQLRTAAEGVGSQHCALINRDRKVFVRDLDSGEPTLVNGEPITPGEEWAMHAGDRLAVGPLEFIVQFHEREMSRRDLEEWAIQCLDAEHGQVKKTAAHTHEEDVFASEGAQDEAARAAATILDRIAAKSGIQQGRVRVSYEHSITVLRVEEADLVDPAEVALIKKELRDQMNHTNQRILLDFKEVKRMSVAGAEMVAGVRSWLKRQSSKMAICRMKPELQRMVQGLAHLDGVPFFAEKPHALSARW
jgi:anti-anti-sigma regulatory factor